MRCDALRVVTVRQERYTVPCGSRYCPACGERWAKDQRIRAVAAAKDLDGDSALVTVTAPGNDRFRRRDPRHKMGRGARMRRWNEDARANWRALHRAARGATRAAIGDPPEGWRLLYRSWEYQSRGALHNHLVLPMATDAQAAWTEEYVCWLWILAREHDFGFVLGGDRGDDPGWEVPPPVKRMDPNAVAAYVSKYVTKASGSGDGMVGVARSTAMRGSVLYVAPVLLRRSGVSMTTLRDRRRIWSRYPFARSGRRGWKEACVVDAVQRGRAPLTQQAVDALREIAGRGVPVVVGQAGRWDVVHPTRAPEPVGLGGWPPREPDGGGYAVVGLASVLLRVPEPEELGWIRTDLRQTGTL